MIQFLVAAALLIAYCTPLSEKEGEGDVDGEGNLGGDENQGRVAEVLRGDTFVLDDGRTIGLIGVTATLPGQRCSDVARQDLERLVLGREVSLESDPHEGENQLEDGIILSRYVFSGGEFVNERMLELGNVWLQRETPYTGYQSELEGAAEEARERGDSCAWAGCVPVLHVIDGDTFYCAEDIGEDTRVRLLGFNTPEEGEPCYGQARNALTVLIGGWYVAMAGDPNANDVDIYGRELRYVSPCESADEGLEGLVNLEMVEGGFACVFMAGGLRLEGSLRAAQERAASNRSGCWEDDPGFCG